MQFPKRGFQSLAQSWENRKRRKADRPKSFFANRKAPLSAGEPRPFPRTLKPEQRLKGRKGNRLRRHSEAPSESADRRRTQKKSDRLSEKPPKFRESFEFRGAKAASQIPKGKPATSKKGASLSGPRIPIAGRKRFSAEVGVSAAQASLFPIPRAPRSKPAFPASRERRTKPDSQF